MGIDIWLAAGVVVATAATDAVYVMFTSSVIARRRLAAASWSSVWYLLSSFAVISYTNNWVYVFFAAIGSWLGAYASMTYLHGPPSHPPAPLKPSPLSSTETPRKRGYTASAAEPPRRRFCLAAWPSLRSDNQGRNRRFL
jgi:hypothetical protein